MYSFAMVAVEVFTGRAPFPRTPPITVAVDVLTGKRPERPMHPNLTDELWNLTERCWNHDPERRPEISEVVLHLKTPSAPRCDGNATPDDDATLASVQRKELPCGSCDQPPRPAGASYKPHWLRKLGRASLTSRPTPGKGPPHDTKLEADEEPEHTKDKNTPRSKDGWFQKYRANPARSRHDCSNGSPGRQGMAVADAWDHISGLGCYGSRSDLRESVSRTANPR